MKRAQCPSCGAEVLFRSADSILAVCEFCRSTLLRKGQDLENLGKMAELMEDTSPVQLGTEGRYQGRHFAVVGRIQLKYDAGIWNEWYLLFDDQSTGWLGETPGLCAVSFLLPPPEPCPAFEELEVGRHFTLNSRDFQVVNLEQPRCIAGEGELPFRVGAGYDTRVADLRGPENAFATLDYSEAPPLLFVGEQLDYKALALTGVRDVSVRGAAVKTEPFQCSRCGAALVPKSEASVTIVCASCGSGHDLNDPKHPLLFAGTRRRKGKRPLIPLGSRGRLRGQDYEVIGFLRRESKYEGIAYPWSEYLLFNHAGGFAWLSEYEGHWNYILPTVQQPAVYRQNGRELARYQGEVYRLFSTAEARCTYVVGEFYWRVMVGETARVREFIAPPKVLSEERMERELLYSIGEYIEGDELREAFKIKQKFPRPIGVHANQPSPWKERLGGIGWLFGLFALALLAMQIGFASRDSGIQVPPMTVQFDSGDAGSSGAAQITRNFRIPKVRRDLKVDADLNTNDLRLDLKILAIKTETGAPIQGVPGTWVATSPNHRRTSFHFSDVPMGRYYLAVSLTGTNVAPGRSITATLNVRRVKTSWGVFVLALIALGAWPGFLFWRNGAFETHRWLQSDEAGD